mgnify:CR=1 FL=1
MAVGQGREQHRLEPSRRSRRSECSGQLRFVRRPLFRDPIPVLFDRSGERYVVLQADGSLDESQTLKLRD